MIKEPQEEDPEVLRRRVRLTRSVRIGGDESKSEGR